MAYKLPNLDFGFEQVDLPVFTGGFEDGFEDRISIGNFRGGGISSIVNPLRPKPIQIDILKPPTTKAKYTSGDELYLSDGTSFVGYYHEMDDGTKMTGKGHNNFSQNLFTLEELGISNDVENETNPNINRLEEDIERANETAEFEKRYPGLLDTVFKEIDEGEYWLNQVFKDKEEYAAVTVTDSISDIPTLRAHIEWILAPIGDKQNVELRDVSQMGKWIVASGDELIDISNTRILAKGGIIKIEERTDFNISQYQGSSITGVQNFGFQDNELDFDLDDEQKGFLSRLRERGRQQTESSQSTGGLFGNKNPNSPYQPFDVPGNFPGEQKFYQGTRYTWNSATMRWKAGGF
tara:strand:+ start:843 stop:1892 length:1050 start_codon:yes stop_codon:yes gene_type:complete